jgi:hypothetical protein
MLHWVHRSPIRADADLVADDLVARDLGCDLNTVTHISGDDIILDRASAARTII